jgi:hypothetical protein
MKKKNNIIILEPSNDLFEDFISKFILEREESIEQEKRVLMDKITIHTHGKGIILDNSL